MRRKGVRKPQITLEALEAEKVSFSCLGYSSVLYKEPEGGAEIATRRPRESPVENPAGLSQGSMQECLKVLADRKSLPGWDKETCVTTGGYGESATR